MRTDFENLEDGQIITLHPNNENPITDRPQTVTYSAGYFWSLDHDVSGPEYYFRDVLKYNHGFTLKD